MTDAVDRYFVLEQGIHFLKDDPTQTEIDYDKINERIKEIGIQRVPFLTSANLAEEKLREHSWYKRSRYAIIVRVSLDPASLQMETTEAEQYKDTSCLNRSGVTPYQIVKKDITPEQMKMDIIDAYIVYAYPQKRK